MKGRVEPSLPSARAPLLQSQGCAAVSALRLGGIFAHVFSARNSVESVSRRQDAPSLTAFRSEHHVRHSSCHILSFGKAMCEFVCRVVRGGGLKLEAELDERASDYCFGCSPSNCFLLPPAPLSYCSHSFSPIQLWLHESALTTSR